MRILQLEVTAFKIGPKASQMTHTQRRTKPSVFFASKYLVYLHHLTRVWIRTEEFLPEDLQSRNRHSEGVSRLQKSH
jgi:hypothetical protein